MTESNSNLPQSISERFLAYSPIMQVLVYTIALQKEKYELLAEIDKLVDDEFRSCVRHIGPFIDGCEEMGLLKEAV
jgi:hypothetical protein